MGFDGWTWMKIRAHLFKYVFIHVCLGACNYRAFSSDNPFHYKLFVKRLSSYDFGIEMRKVRGLSPSRVPMVSLMGRCLHAFCK